MGPGSFPFLWRGTKCPTKRENGGSSQHANAYKNDQREEEVQALTSPSCLVPFASKLTNKITHSHQIWPMKIEGGWFSLCKIK